MWAGEENGGVGGAGVVGEGGEGREGEAEGVVGRGAEGLGVDEELVGLVAWMGGGWRWWGTHSSG